MRPFQNLLAAFLLVAAGLSLAPEKAEAGHCSTCKPAPVTTHLCVVDPCTHCTYDVCVCLPACCAHETPCMTWQKAAFGRKVLTYTWKCCGHQVDVLITKRGKVKVR